MARAKKFGKKATPEEAPKKQEEDIEIPAPRVNFQLRCGYVLCMKDGSVIGPSTTGAIGLSAAQIAQSLPGQDHKIDPVQECREGSVRNRMIDTSKG